MIFCWEDGNARDVYKTIYNVVHQAEFHLLSPASKGWEIEVTIHKLAYINSTTWNRDACTAEQLFLPKECLVIMYLS